MKKKVLFVMILVLLSFTNAMSMDWSSIGFSVVESGEKDTEKFVVLKDSQNNQFRVRYYDDFNEKWGKVVKSLNTDFRNWKSMKVQKLEFFQNNDSLEILVVPSSFKYKGVNFIPSIPGGLVFIYDYSLNYNFRLNKDNYFVRINDRFVNEAFLCERMKEAYDDPVSYLKKREPEFFLQKLNELEDSLLKLKKSHAAILESHGKLQDAVMYYENSGFLGFGNTKIKKDVVKKVIELKKDKPSLKAPEIVKVLEKQKVKASEKEVSLILNVFYGEYEK